MQICDEGTLDLQHKSRAYSKLDIKFSNRIKFYKLVINVFRKASLLVNQN